MIIITQNGQSFDTDKDLTAAERHILQKLLFWESMATSLSHFREKKREAYTKGWNNSGPVKPGHALVKIVADMENKVRSRHPK